MSAERFLRSFLTTDDALSALLGATDESPRAFAVLAPLNQATPYVVYAVEGEDPVETMGGEDALRDAAIDVTIYANRETGLDVVGKIAARIRAILQRYNNESERAANAGREEADRVVIVQDCYYEGYSDAFGETERDFNRTLSFRLWYEDAA